MKYSYQKDKTYIYKKHLYQKDKIYKLLSKMEGEIDIKSSGLADFIEQNGGVLYQNECISLGSESILQLAFKHNDYVAINSMIEKFPELLSAKTVKDYSLMHIAATCVDEEMIEYLIGKDDQLMYIRGKDETNPLHIACMHGNSSAIKKFMEINPLFAYETNSYGKNMLHLLTEHFSGVTAVNTMLLGIHGALNQGSNEIIRDLIAAKDNENKTCVDYAKDSGAYLRFSSAIMFLCNDLSDLGLAQGSFSTSPARDNFLITQLNGSKMYEVYTIGDHEHSFGQYDITDFSC